MGTSIHTMNSELFHRMIPGDKIIGKHPSQMAIKAAMNNELHFSI